jgi:hypothetical protein
VLALISISDALTGDRAKGRSSEKMTCFAQPCLFRMTEGVPSCLKSGDRSKRIDKIIYHELFLDR